MYVSRINLDKSQGEDEYTEDKEGHTENEDDPHTEIDLLPSKKETAVYTLFPPPPLKKNKFYALNFILSTLTYGNWDTNNQIVNHHYVKSSVFAYR